MNLIKTKIDGLVIIEPHVIKDKRGYFIETYNHKNLGKFLGNINFVQENESMSSKGVLRGLHFQTPPYTQAKLVKCVKGCILDVALDLRRNSRTFGKYEVITISEKNKYQLFIPKGFAHGFIVLSKSSLVSYKVDNYYNPKSESGVIWNDPTLNIDWKMNKNKIVISEKDKKLLPLAKISIPF